MANEGEKPAQPVSPLQPDILVDPAGDCFIVAPSVLDPSAPLMMYGERFDMWNDLFGEGFL